MPEALASNEEQMRALASVQPVVKGEKVENCIESENLLEKIIYCARLVENRN